VSTTGHICIRHGTVNTIAEPWCYLLGVCKIRGKLSKPSHKGITKKSSPRIVEGDGVEAHEMKRYGRYPFEVKRSHTSLFIALLSIPMKCGSACAIEKHINESIAYYGGAIEKHLMDSSSFYKRLS